MCRDDCWNIQQVLQQKQHLVLMVCKHTVLKRCSGQHTNCTGMIAGNCKFYPDMDVSPGSQFDVGLVRVRGSLLAPQFELFRPLAMPHPTCALAGRCGTGCLRCLGDLLIRPCKHHHG